MYYCISICISRCTGRAGDVATVDIHEVVHAIHEVVHAYNVYSILWGYVYTTYCMLCDHSCIYSVLVILYAPPKLNNQKLLDVLRTFAY